MKITYLGHAGFCVETPASFIIMDPWLSPQGAFDASWFQYPKNHHMADFVQHILSTSTKDKYIYISHEHKDHFDIPFLESLQSRNFTLLLANFSYPVIKRTLDSIHYHCKKMVLLNNEEPFQLKDGKLCLFIIDGELNCDSAILVKSESSSFLNINDCKIHDQLTCITKQYGPIDIFTAQFSGASWYPTCYQMTPSKYRQACEKKITGKFEAIAEAINIIKPRMYLPSAGPPCFLDPLLFNINFQEINSYPRAPQIIHYLDQHWKGSECSTKWTEIAPGDALDVGSLRFTHRASDVVDDKQIKPYIVAYADAYKAFFEERMRANDKINPQDVFLRLQEELQHKIDALKLVNEKVSTLLYWAISEHPNNMICMDLAHKTLKITDSIDDPSHYCKITAPAWQVNKVLNREISWPDFALTFRLKIERVPDVYNTILHGFLILDAEKIGSFCEKMATTYKRKDRVLIEYNGKKYSVLRYCPHQGADLAEGHVDGTNLVCPRHQWEFDLEKGGQCIYNDSSIDAICIHDGKKPPV